MAAAGAGVETLTQAGNHRRIVKLLRQYPTEKQQESSGARNRGGTIRHRAFLLSAARRFYFSTALFLLRKNRGDRIRTCDLLTPSNGFCDAKKLQILRIFRHFNHCGLSCKALR
jgi:hypothetical protein